MVDSDDALLQGVHSFVAVVQHGGFRQAARALGLPKSTVSQRVAHLEARLGAPLLHRTTRTVTLTDEGDGFHHRVVPALQALGEAAKLVRDAQSTPTGVLRVTAPLAMVENTLADVLVAYAQAYPDVRLVLDLTDRYVDLVAEGYDLALRAGPLPDSTLKARLLGEGQLLCVASPAYLTARGTPRTPSDLAEHDCIAFTAPQRRSSWVFRQRRAALTVALEPRFSVNSLVLARQLAVAGLGITRLPQALAFAELGAGQLVEVLEAYAPPPAPIHAVYPPAAQVPPKVRAFVDLLVTQLAAQPALAASRRSRT